MREISIIEAAHNYLIAEIQKNGITAITDYQVQRAWQLAEQMYSIEQHKLRMLGRPDVLKDENA